VMEKNAVEGKRCIILGGVFHSLVCFTRLSSTLRYDINYRVLIN
jgi:hypothetical protein